MSAARRLKRKRDPGSRSRLRRLDRSRLEHRAAHWRRLNAGFTVDDWRRPMDQECRVAYLSTPRCCREGAIVPMVVTLDEELSADSDIALQALVRERFATAEVFLRRLVTPTRVFRRKVREPGWLLASAWPIFQRDEFRVRLG